MNEEEKKVINSLENEYKKLEEKGNILFPLYKQQTRTVLNIITKLQKENQKLNLMIAKSTAQRVLTDIKHSKKSNEDLEMLAKGYDIEIQKLQKENELQKENYKNLILDVSRIAIELGLEEDGTIDEIYSKIKEKDKQIDLMVEYINNIQDCPLENCGVNLDCENRCNNDEKTIKQCWIKYFEKLAKESRG